VKVYEEVDSERDAEGKALLPTLAALSHKRRVFETLNDLALSVFCYYGAFLLLFELPLSASLLRAFADTLPIVVAAQLAVFLALGLYRGLWRYTGMDDLFVIVRSVLGALAASIVSLHLLAESKQLSFRLMTIDGLLLLVAVGGTRISFRLFHRWFEHRRAPQGLRVLIYGAGDGGELLLRELQSNRALGLTPVGFVDDDPAKLGRVIHGVPVLGTSSGLAEIQVGARANQLLLSTSLIAPDQWERVVATCSELGLQPRRAKMVIE
jgi:UDP-GlcNAc:undecaprenyl-phosphate GlcNAc-1-phosphate transferase